MTEERPVEAGQEVDEFDGLDLDLLFNGSVENTLESRVGGNNQNTPHPATNIQSQAVVSSSVHNGAPVMGTAGNGSGNEVNQDIPGVISKMQDDLRHLIPETPPSPGTQTPPPLPPSLSQSASTMPQNCDRSLLRQQLMTDVLDLRSDTPGNTEALSNILGSLIGQMSQKSPSNKYQPVKLDAFVRKNAGIYVGRLGSIQNESVRVIFHSTILVMVYAIAVRVFGYTYTENMESRIDEMVRAALSSPAPPTPYLRDVCHIMCSMYYHADKNNKEIRVLAASWCLGGNLVWANGGGDQAFNEAKAISAYLSGNPDKVIAYVEGVYNQCQSQQPVQAIQQLASPPSALPRASSATEWESRSGEPGRPTSLLRTHSEQSEFQGFPYPAPLSTAAVEAEEHSRLSSYNMVLSSMQIDDGDYHQPSSIVARSDPAVGLFSTVTGQPGSVYSAVHLDRFRSHSADFSPPPYAYLSSSSNSWQHSPRQDQHSMITLMPPPTNDVSMSSSFSPPQYRSRSHNVVPSSGHSSQNLPRPFPIVSPSHQSSASLGAGQHNFYTSPFVRPVDRTARRPGHHQPYYPVVLQPSTPSTPTFSSAQMHEAIAFIGNSLSDDPAPLPLPHQGNPSPGVRLQLQSPGSLPSSASNSVSSTPVHYLSSPRPQSNAAMASGGGVDARRKGVLSEAVAQVAQDDGGVSYMGLGGYSSSTPCEQTELHDSHGRASKTSRHGTTDASRDEPWRTHSEQSELQGFPYPTPLSTAAVEAEEHSRLSSYNMVLSSMQIDDGDYHQPTSIVARSDPAVGLFSTVTGQPGSRAYGASSAGQMDSFGSHSADFSPPPYALPSSSDSWQHPIQDQHSMTSRTPRLTNDVSVSYSNSNTVPLTGHSSPNLPHPFPIISPSHQASPSLGAGQHYFTSMSSAPTAITAPVSSSIDTVSHANTHDSRGSHSSAQTQQRSTTAAVSTTKKRMPLSSSPSRPHPFQPHLSASSGRTQSLPNPQPSAPSTPISRHPSTDDKSPRGGGHHHGNPNENELNKG